MFYSNHSEQHHEKKSLLNYLDHCKHNEDILH